MANYITCKDTRSFAYSETTNKGYYELVSVSEDGITCTVKCVYHENKEYINKEYELLNERITEDFEAVDEVKVFTALEATLIAETDWRVTATTEHKYSDIVHRNVSDYTNTNTNIWNRNCYREIRHWLYIPNDESTEFPRKMLYHYNGVKNSVEECLSTINHIKNRITDGYDVESFFVVNDDIFNTALSSIKDAIGVEPVDLPDELKMHLRSQEYKAVVFQKDNMFIYITNVRCDHILFASMIYTAEHMGRPLPEAAKAALLARDREAYNAAIYVNIEEAVAGIEKRAKEKMFADFSSKFGEMSLKPMKNRVYNLERKYDNELQVLQDVLLELQNAREKLFYAEHGVTSDNGEFVEFINSVKDNLVSIKIEDDFMYFCVRTFLTFWDEELWEIFRKSDHGFSRLANWQKCLLDDIFTSRTIKLLFEQKFYFDLRRNYVGRSTDYDSVIGEGTRGMHNPHIDQYDCWGTHKPHINKYISEFDCMQAYSQAVACISGLTLSDSTVVNVFLNWLSKKEIQQLPCLYVAETGEYITMAQYKEANKDRKWEV